jgi:dihydrolipoamide dehydrogenase
MIEVDVIIIGAGPGGYETAAEAAHLGKNVVLIERDELGGTCLNRGCIPTKCLCRSAEVISTIKESQAFGVQVDGISYDYAKAVERMGEVVGQLREGVASVLKGVTVVKGEAKFESSHVVSVGDEQYTAPQIIIATGSAPAMLPIEGAELAITSDELLKMTELPKSIVIIGGGVIGMEFASILNAFGVEVTVIEFLKEILPPFDKDIAKRLRSTLSRRGINIITGAGVTALHPGITVDYQGKKGIESVHADVVVMAVGRRPVVPQGTAEAGIEVGRRGVVTNDKLETTAAGVYAIGDVNCRCMLAHAATAQGRVVLGEDIDLSVVPSAVFTSPEVAMVGLTEEQCKEKGLNIKVTKAMFGGNGKALAMGEGQGLVKLICDADNGKILGCHILGPHAADLVQEPATVMASGLSVKAIATSIHGHPTLSEVVLNAAMQF